MKIKSLLGSVGLLLILVVLVKAVFLFAGGPSLVGGGDNTYYTNHFPDGYDRIAMNLINGHGYRFSEDTAPTIFRTPGFVFVLVALFATFGKSLLAVKIFHFLVSCCTALLVFRLGLRVGTSRPVALTAVLIYFLHPGTVLADGRGGLETVFTFLVVSFTLLVYRALERDRLRDFTAAGLLFGLLLLVKSTAALFPGFLFFYLGGRRTSVTRLTGAGARIAVLVAAALLVLSPWVVRNYMLVGKIIPTVTLQGAAVFQGVHVVKARESGKEHWELLAEAAKEQDRIVREMGMDYELGFFPSFYTTEDEVHYYAHLGKLGIGEYQQAPGLLVEAIAFNAYAFWFQGRMKTATKLNLVVTVPFLLFIGAGLELGRRRKLHLAPLLLFVLAYYVVHLPVCAVARYHVPLIPLLAVPAGLTVWSLVQARRTGAGGGPGR